jgi:hypothetical protein
VSVIVPGQWFLCLKFNNDKSRVTAAHCCAAVP